jgi:hypothetical protein
MLGLCDWGHAIIYCVLFVRLKTLTAQCNAIFVQLHSDTDSLCTQNGTAVFLFVVAKQWDSSRNEGEN